MDQVSKEWYLKEKIKDDINRDLRLGISLGFSKEQILKLFQEVTNT